MTDVATTREPTAMVLSATDLPSPVFRGAQMVQALTAYRELQKALDESMPDQVMTLEGRPFRKKGYWRAIAVAFNLTVEPIDERRDVSDTFADGRSNFGYIVTYRATSAGGRSATGDGSCFAVEKARRFKCPHPEGNNSKRTLHFPQESCPDYDPLYQWKTLPGQATEHNIRSHAHTRAFNRAVSNLVGFGEVSAEEVERDEHGADTGPTTVPKRADGTALVTEAGTKTGTSKTGKAWTMYTISFDDGRSGSTFDEKIAAAADAAKDAGTLVLPILEQKGQYWNLIGLESAKAESQAEIPLAGNGSVVLISANQVTRFHAVAKGHGWTEAERAELLSAKGYGSSKDIPAGEIYDEIIAELKERGLAAR